MKTENLSPSLSVELRQSTILEHSETESSQFIKSLFNGTFIQKDYVTYLWALKEIYQSLERGIEQNKNHASLSPIYFPELFRFKALSFDLQIWSSTQLPEISESCFIVFQKIGPAK